MQSVPGRMNVTRGQGRSQVVEPSQGKRARSNLARATISTDKGGVAIGNVRPSPTRAVVGGSRGGSWNGSEQKREGRPRDLPTSVEIGLMFDSHREPQTVDAGQVDGLIR